ncbi:hypothetical protein Tco_0705965 [Tanacetum coccineum]|uniref:Reverse transcriptase domain-containing protein n=1 Tax=Tanacetum coccineum TaxID=301880 RepID=A0ABQ4Y614_9ASTR
MEILTLILQRRVCMSDSFRYHKQCEELKIINVCFADDLFLFARGDVASAMVIMESLNEFQHVSGLIPSIPKSTVFFCNVVNHVKVGILSIMPFSEGELPVKYLGVPHISSRLLNKDCKILVEKARSRIGDWKNKSLSFAGRLQLYWESICLPKSEGGLGLRSLEVFNLALMTTHIWNIVTHKESLWVWRYVCTFAGMYNVNLTLADIMLWCQPLTNKRTVKGVVGKLIFAAASYYVWLERNNRLFKSIRRQPEELCDLIIVTVRLKLLTFKFKNTAKVESLLSL